MGTIIFIITFLIVLIGIVQIGFSFSEMFGNSDVNAVRRTAAHAVEIFLQLNHPKGLMQGERMTRRTFLFERSDDRNVRDLPEKFVKDVDTSGMHTVIVTEKDPHRPSVYDRDPDQGMGRNCPPES